jgi:hypothetical protein
MQTPIPPVAPAAENLRIQLGTNEVQVVPARDGAATQALEVQASTLKTRIAGIAKEIAAVKAEMNTPGSAPLMPSNQLRLTGLEGRRTDAEEALQRVEDQLAGISTQPAFTTEVGTPAEFPGIPFDPNQSALQEKLAIISMTAIVCIGMPIAIAIARRIWKRTTAQLGAADRPDDPQRLARLEQAVDTIAVEMERMSEGQRYVTRLLAERAEVPVGSGMPRDTAER